MLSDKRPAHQLPRWGHMYGIMPKLVLSNQASDIKSSQYYKIAKSAYDFLSKNRRQDGSIFDVNSKSTLDWQYHMGMYIFSSVVLYKLHGEKSYYHNAYETFKYYIKVSCDVKKGSLDFNNLPLMLSYFILAGDERQTGLNVQLKNFIKSMKHYASIQNPTHGNNFLTLRALNHLLRFKILENREDLDLSKKLIYATLRWQFEDGIFYDYPIDFFYKNGIPQISYHALISLFVLLYGVISNDQLILDRAEYALKALSKLIANDGEAFYYGRTNNALVGYPCAILAYRIGSQISKDSDTAKDFSYYEELLFQYCSKRHLAEDGHLYIASNSLEDLRSGFDIYMYVSVYNALTMALLFISSIIKSSVKVQKKSPDTEIHYLGNSGFIVKRGEKLSTAINLKGHSYSRWYLFDPRLVCYSPLFIKYKSHDLLPSPPFSPKNVINHDSFQKSGKRYTRLKRLIKNIHSASLWWKYLDDYNPLNSGFLPYLKKKTCLFFPIYTQAFDISQAENGILVAHISGTFIRTNTRGFYPLFHYVLPRLNSNLKKIFDPYLYKYSVRVSAFRLERRIYIHDHFIHFYDNIQSADDTQRGFTVRTYADWRHEMNKNRFIIRKNGYGFALILDKGDVLNNSSKLLSSKGETLCWDFINKKKCLLKNEPKSIILEHSFIPFDNDFSLEDASALFNDQKARLLNMPVIQLMKSDRSHGMNWIDHSSWEKRRSTFSNINSYFP